MQTFFTLIGFTACFAALTVAIIKAIETVWFFQEFRKDVTKSLAKIEERISNLKP